MREIKFRAWNGMNMFVVTDVDFSKQTVGEMFRPSLRNEYSIDEVKLMQYTGLKDRNGVEIYEGDVVTAREQSNKATFTGRVHFLNAQYWVNYAGYESYYAPLIQLHNAVYKPIEVIGNIYEHPHLLEGRKSE